MTIRSTASARCARLVGAALIVAATAAGHAAHASPASPASPAKQTGRSLTYDEAVALLKVPDRWCDGAAALARLGDHRAIGPLYRVVARSDEGLPDRTCVHDALEKLGVRDEVVKFAASQDPAERRTGIELMRACPADSHVAILVRVALHDPDPDLRALAARTLRTQKITPAWEVAMIALLDAADNDTRELAASSLQRRYGVTILAALRNRLKAETQAAVRVALEAAIHHHEIRATARP